MPSGGAKPVTPGVFVVAIELMNMNSDSNRNRAVRTWTSAFDTAQLKPLDLHGFNVREFRLLAAGVKQVFELSPASLA